MSSSIAVVETIPAEDADTEVQATALRQSQFLLTSYIYNGKCPAAISVVIK